MSRVETAALSRVLAPHVVAVALTAARLLPVSVLCPFLGGALVPGFLRLGLVLVLSGSLHALGAVAAPPEALASGEALVALALRECVLGVCMGLIAGLPFDAARMGGTWVDLMRGTSAEATLPAAGTREAATANALFQLVLAAACSGPIIGQVVRSLFLSFSLVRLGTFEPTLPVALQLCNLVVATMGTGIAVGAPVVALALGVDAVVGLLGRAAPQLGLAGASAPLKILGGGALLWLTLGLLAQALLAEVARGQGRLMAFLGG